MMLGYALGCHAPKRCEAIAVTTEPTRTDQGSVAMSKICQRDYSDNSMLAVKSINGIDCCTLCEQPAVCHGKPIYHRALYWFLAGNTGISSKTLVCHMLNYPLPNLSLPPSDEGDRGRCIRLLELVPEWIPRLPELAKNEAPSDGVVINSSGIHAQTMGWAEQIPLILKEGKF